MYYSIYRRHCQQDLVFFGIFKVGIFSRFFDKPKAHSAEISRAEAEIAEPQPFWGREREPYPIRG